MAASPMPVFPEVGSMMTEPGLSLPSCSAASIMAFPTRSLTLPAGFVPKVLNTTIYDQIITATEEESYCQAKKLAKSEGILVGISSGAALQAAIKLASQEAYEGKTIVVILPDSGDRYYSTPLFMEE